MKGILEDSTFDNVWWAS